MENMDVPLSVNEKIALLEQQQDENLAELKYQLSETTESLKPVNLIKDAGSKLVRSGSFRKKVLIGVVGLGVGYLVKKMFYGKPTSSMKKILGFAAPILAAKIAYKVLP